MRDRSSTVVATPASNGTGSAEAAEGIPGQFVDRTIDISVTMQRQVPAVQVVQKMQEFQVKLMDDGEGCKPTVLSA